MAFCAALDAQLCNRESLVRIVPDAEKSCDRRRLRSRPYQQLHTLGDLWRFHLYSASTTLAPEEMSQVSHRSPKSAVPPFHAGLLRLSRIQSCPSVSVGQANRCRGGFLLDYSTAHSIGVTQPADNLLRSLLVMDFGDEDRALLGNNLFSPWRTSYSPPSTSIFSICGGRSPAVTKSSSVTAGTFIRLLRVLAFDGSPG